MTADERFLQQFKDSFSKDKKIVIYGLGRKAQLILDSFPYYNILGLMDGYTVDGYAYGKKIISYEEVSKLKPDMIIIATRPTIMELIRNRISRFCLSNNIEVFSAEGVKIQLEDNLAEENHPYFEVNKEILKRKIEEYDNISFDIFDTLIMRKVLFPKDIFGLVQRKALEEKKIKCDFVNYRVEAEKRLFTYMVPNLEEIYNEIQVIACLTDEQKHYLMQLELKSEEKMLICRREMVEIFEYALSLNKKVYLISDMYLPEEWLQNTLAGLGISGYEKIFVSCEYRTTKGQQLFIKYLESVDRASCLHIGDSEPLDIEAANRNGIDSFRIYSALDMLQISTYKEIIYTMSTLNHRIQIGLFISKLFNSPFSLYQSKGKGYVQSAYDIGYLFVAPLIAEFMKWFLNEVIKARADYILFAARDGFLIQQLYEKAREIIQVENLPRGSYFLTSRIACVATTIYSEEDIIDAIKIPFDGQPEMILLNRFLLKKEDIMPYKMQQFDNIEEYILHHKERILKNASKLRERYLKYIGELDILNDDNIVFFDFVSSGTCQLKLNKLLRKELKGYYFHRFYSSDSEKQKLKIEDMYKNEGILAANSLFMECLMTSFNPTFKEYDENMTPLYMPEKRTDNELEYITEAHKGIKDYFTEVISEMDFMKEEQTEKLFAEKFLGYIFKSYSEIDNEVFGNYVIDDEFHNQNLHVSNIYKY